MSSLVVAYFFGINFLLTFCYNLEGGDHKFEDIDDNLASPRNLTKWAERECIMYQYFKESLALGNYDKHSWISKSALAEYLKDFEDSNGFDERHGEDDIYFNDVVSQGKEVSSNPIMVYRMLYRINKYRKTIEEFGSEPYELEGNGKIVEKEDMWELLEFRKETLPPTGSDAIEAMNSILRLHQFYDLNLSEFTSGVIAGIKTNTKLDAIHCFELGIHASTIGYFDLSIEWLEMAYSKVHFEYDTSLKSSKINRDRLESIVKKHDEAFRSIPPWVPIVYNDTLLDNYYLPSYGSPCNNRNRTRRKAILNDKWKGDKATIFHEINFWGLCSGENYQTEKEKSELYCWLDSGKNQGNILCPSKMELLSSYPYIVQIYDAIGAKLADRIILKARFVGYKRSHVLTEDYKHKAMENVSLVSNYRTSATSWLWTTTCYDDEQEPDLVNIEKRIESITGLNTEGNATEPLQVASYVFGRHFNVHTDTYTGINTVTGWNGDRFATFMIYLDEPLAGGLTAFVHAGVAAKPVKGSAVFWYNLNRNGSNLDDITWHGGCPVLLGYKHIANKWIQFEQQFLAAPCPRNQNDAIGNVL